MTQNSGARKRHEDATDPDVFGIFIDRSDYRDFMPTPFDTKEYRCLSRSRGHYWSFGDVPCIAAETVDGTAKFSGPLYNLRATLDQLELAYDRLANPPKPTNPWTSAPALRSDS